MCINMWCLNIEHLQDLNLPHTEIKTFTVYNEYGDIVGRERGRDSADLTQFFQPRSLEILKHVHIYHALVVKRPVLLHVNTVVKIVIVRNQERTEKTTTTEVIATQGVYYACQNRTQALRCACM